MTESIPVNVLQYEDRIFVSLVGSGKELLNHEFRWIDGGFNINDKYEVCHLEVRDKVREKSLHELINLCNDDITEYKRIERYLMTNVHACSDIYAIKNAYEHCKLFEDQYVRALIVKQFATEILDIITNSDLLTYIYTYSTEDMVPAPKASRILLLPQSCDSTNEYSWFLLIRILLYVGCTFLWSPQLRTITFGNSVSGEVVTGGEVRKQKMEYLIYSSRYNIIGVDHYDVFGNGFDD